MPAHWIAASGPQVAHKPLQRRRSLPLRLGPYRLEVSGPLRWGLNWRERCGVANYPTPVHAWSALRQVRRDYVADLEGA